MTILSIVSLSSKLSSIRKTCCQLKIELLFSIKLNVVFNGDFYNVVLRKRNQKNSRAFLESAIGLLHGLIQILIYSTATLCSTMLRYKRFEKCNCNNLVFCFLLLSSHRFPHHPSHIHLIMKYFHQECFAYLYVDVQGCMRYFQDVSSLRLGKLDHIAIQTEWLQKITPHCIINDITFVSCLRHRKQCYLL